MSTVTGMQNGVAYVIDKVRCEEHDAALGEPCWTVRREFRGAALLAVCNRRARAAGCVGATSTRPQPAQQAALAPPATALEARYRAILQQDSRWRTT